uniref:PRAME family member 5-like n=1 Tax=Ictidomys tridecemlineatus TaxID=43179 RepID=UPI001A9EFA8A|nr:PRAME family member 5-like [Ictidomys tridecemlineatus]
MSIHSPPTLLELAGHILLSDKSRAVLDLEDLPIELFPPLFVEAFSRGHSEVLKKIVQAWPFTRLPLGALMRKPQLEMIQVVLDGLDMLFAQQNHPRLPDVAVLVAAVVTHEGGYTCPCLSLYKWGNQAGWEQSGWRKNFWKMWSGVLVDGCSPEEIKKNQTLKLGPAMAAKPPFNVVIDLSLRKRPLVEFMTHLFLWVRQRKDKLHLCCNRLKIVGKPTSYTRKVLRLLQLDSVQKVEVHCAWAPFTLAACAPLFSQMRNLRKLFVSKIYVSAYTSQKEQEQLLAQLTSQFLRMDCLQKFCANALFLLEGHLEQAPEDPPETLSITNCPLSDSDWNYLSRYPNARQLRHLELRGIKLTDFSLKPLQILLDSTATTLNILDLATSCITDSQLQALLPALSRCS